MLLCSEYLDISSEEKNSVIITVDLNEYIRAFNDKSKNYDELHAHFRHVTSTFTGEYLFSLVMETIAQHFTDDALCGICKTPAYDYVSEYFIEILKNTIDEIIIRSCTMPEVTGSAVAILTLHIEYSPEKDRVKFLFKDNGSGFSDGFLERTNSVSAKNDYFKSKGSVKQSLQESYAMPKLFGGFGRGLRCIMARVLTGCDLSPRGRLTPCFAQPKCSTINFSNAAEGGGAVIEIESSCEPLRRVEKRALSPMQLHLPSKFFKQESTEKKEQTVDTNIMNPDKSGPQC